MDTPLSLTIFCKVVDNFGDIGICWRLAKQLRHEHGLAVTLWVDDLQSFKRICTDVETGRETQELDGISVRHWRNQDEFTPDDVTDIVIEFFGCDIPPNYIAVMARCQPRPVWLNLEGLTAEEWVEGCHTLPSRHPRMPLTKHFFFPGFTGKTGGLLHESALEVERLQFQSDHAAVTEFLARLRLTPSEMTALKVSMFCYPHAPLAALFDAWQRTGKATTCLVPEGVAIDAVKAFLDGEAKPGAARTRGALTVRVLPFVSQLDYDKLLWACDINFVRGEDSFVRAQWAGKPFVWHIYPQDKNLHHVKLRAFLQRYAIALPGLSNFSLTWNDAGPAVQSPDWPGLWESFQAEMPQMTEHSAGWWAQMRLNGDLASNMLAFAAALSVGRENHV